MFAQPFAPILALARPALVRGRSALSGQLVRGVGAFGGAEIANRAVRLVATVVIARQLAPEIVGEAALALTMFELVRVLGGVGIGQRIIAASKDELAAVCNTARRLFWAWSFVLVAIQCGVAAILALAFAHPSAGTMLAVLSLVYLTMPAGLVCCYLAMREGRNAALARTAASQAIADHLLTAALLIAWPSPWSIVLPKLLTTPIWLVMTRRNRPWRAEPAAGYACWRAMSRFGTGVLAAEAMNALRQQGDKVIVVAMMGSTALGTYYFAWNAGLGIVGALVGAFGTVSYPMLCAAPAGQARHGEMRKILLAAALFFVPLIAAQALLAPFYVPILFGAHWAFAAPLIAVLCLAGFAQLASVLNANWLRAEGRVGHDAARSLLVCVLGLGGMTLGAMSGSLQAAAAGLVAGSTLGAILCAFITLAPALRRNSNATAIKEAIA